MIEFDESWTYKSIEWEYPAWVLMLSYNAQCWALPLSLHMDFTNGYHQLSVLCFAVTLIKRYRVSSYAGTAMEGSAHESTRAPWYSDGKATD